MSMKHQKEYEALKNEKNISEVIQNHAINNQSFDIFSPNFFFVLVISCFPDVIDTFLYSSDFEETFLFTFSSTLENK